MKKIIKEYKTIISDNIIDFNNKVNSHLKNGWEILENSYTMNTYSKSDINIVVKVYKKKSDDYETSSDYHEGNLTQSFSQVLVYKDEIEYSLSFDDNGILKTRSLYKNGELNGDYTTYDEYGIISTTGNYKDGLKVGKWIFYINGEKSSEYFHENGGYKKITYIDGRKCEETNKNKDGQTIGKRIIWYENGQKEFEQLWKDDKRDGKEIGWYENGQKSREETYKKDLIDGKSTHWYENGQKKEEGTYKDGELISSYKAWNEDGSV